MNTDDGGSFCGMFWSEKHNFIVVTFKGTTPSNFIEWLNNATFQCVDARTYLFGQVHKGFYNYLFPSDDEIVGKNYPCQKIFEAIDCKASSIYSKRGGKVNVWITGHSLGGALAALFYARLLRTRYDENKDKDEDKGKDWVLREAITFAAPAIGDHHFAAELAYLVREPRNVKKPLRRIVLKEDVVPKLPHRACDKRMKKYGYNYNVLMNYSQVGEKIIFKGGDKEPLSFEEFFTSTSDNNLQSYCDRYKKRHVIRKMIKRNIKNLRIITRLIRMIKSHSVNGYFKALAEYETVLVKRFKPENYSNV